MKKVVLLALTALFISFASCRDKKEDVSASEALIEEMQDACGIYQEEGLPGLHEKHIDRDYPDFWLRHRLT